MPISFNKKFQKSETEISHYYIFDNIFIQYADAEKFCDENNIPYDFIVKTKWYVK